MPVFWTCVGISFRPHSEQIALFTLSKGIQGLTFTEIHLWCDTCSLLAARQVAGPLHVVASSDESEGIQTQNINQPLSYTGRATHMRFCVETSG